MLKKKKEKIKRKRNRQGKKQSKLLKLDREQSLSFEGVGLNKTNMESVRLENWPKFPCVSEIRPREQAVELILFAL